VAKSSWAVGLRGGGKGREEGGEKWVGQEKKKQMQTK